MNELKGGNNYFPFSISAFPPTNDLVTFAVPFDFAMERRSYPQRAKSRGYKGSARVDK
jgi:hypothetical protein